jgi:hypothetical protein
LLFILGKKLWNILHSAIFLKKIGSGMHSDPKFDQRGGGDSYINAKEKTFQNAVPVCVLVRKLLEWRSGTFHHKNTPDTI